MIWHSATLEETAEELQVNYRTGLSDAIANVRLKDMGENFTPSMEVSSFGKKLLSRFKRPVIIMMIAASIISVAVEYFQPAGVENVWSVPLACILITAITVLIETAKNIICEKYICDSQKRTMPTATVRRSGTEKQISSINVVQGDIIILKAGMCVPADARLIESNNLSCNESVISGLQSPVMKDAGFECTDITPLSERANMVYAGSWVIHGDGVAVVTETSTSTEIGKRTSINRKPILFGMKTNIKNASKSVSVILPYAMAVMFVLFFIITRFARETCDLTLLTLASRDLIIVASLAVAAAPTWITNIASVTAAIGLKRLEDKHLLISDPEVVEKFGRIDCLCIDKSSLTDNDLTVTEYFNGREMVSLQNNRSADVATVLKLACACSEQNSDATDQSLIRACFDYAHVDKPEIDNLYPKLSYSPFDHETMLSVSVNMIDGTPYAIIKGAVESVIPRCDGNAEYIMKSADAMGAKSLRVIAVAAKPLSDVSSAVNPSGSEMESGFAFLGLFGLSDHMKTESLKAVNECREADVKVVMLTGDSLSTAKSVARQAGILSDDTEAVTGLQLNQMNDVEFDRAVERCTVFARITPADRLRIVEALQNNGHTVSVTGRTPADAAAIAKADVGCAMGKTGSDVAKYSSDVIVTDDSFASVLYVIKGGRNMTQSIRRSIHSAMCAEISVCVMILLGYIFFGRSLISPAQVLFSSFIVNLFPAISLSYENYVKLYKLDTRVRADSYFDYGRRIDIIWHSVVIGVLSMVSYAICLNAGRDIASGASLITLISSNLLLTMSLRSRKLIINNGILSNIICIITMAFSLIIAVISIYIPVIGVQRITGAAAITVCVLSIIPFALSEVGKVVKFNILRRKEHE